MHEDAEQNCPFIAALIVSWRGKGLPAQGFFDLAVALGRFPADPVLQAEAGEFEEVLAVIG
ncbi:hypothetical protein [Salinicola halophilus]|uniref:hypothetical protein n=1 Tax=Salinicola halophilus TaxID=184065 RepID=UPI0030840330